jgi:hypothetical protein
MRSYVVSTFNLLVVTISVLLFGAGMRWVVTRQIGEMDGILLLTGFVMAAIVFAHKLLVADFEPLSITKLGAPNLLA